MCYFTATNSECLQIEEVGKLSVKDREKTTNTLELNVFLFSGKHFFFKIRKTDC